MFVQYLFGGPEGDRTLEPHGCEPCALPAELRAHIVRLKADFCCHSDSTLTIIAYSFEKIQSYFQFFQTFFAKTAARFRTPVLFATQKRTNPCASAVFLVDRVDKRGDQLLLARDDALEPDRAGLRRAAERLLHKLLGGFAVAHQPRRLLDDVRQHEVHHREAVLAAGLLEVRAQLLLNLVELAAAHAVDLTDAERDVAEFELLVILVENFLRRLVLEVAAGREHFDAERLAVDARNGAQRIGRHAVHHRAGRRAENKRVGEDRAAQKPRDLRRDVVAFLPVDLVDDRRGAADRLVPEIDRRHRLERADPVVVDDLEDLGVLDVVDRLSPLVVVDEDDRALADREEVPAGDHADVVPGLVDDREVADARVLHAVLDRIRVIARQELDQPLAAHERAHGHALVDAARDGVRVERRDDHGAAVLVRELADAARDRRAEADHDAARTRLDRRKLRFIAVARNDHVVLMDVILHHVRFRGGNQHVAALEHRLRVADDHLGLERLQNVAVRRFRLRDDRAVLILHVGGRDVVDRDDAVEPVFLVDDRQRDGVQLRHHVPCLFHRDIVGNAGDLPDIHIPHAGADVVDVRRLAHAEAVQDVARLRAELPGARRDVAVAVVFPVLDVRIGDRRADGVGVGVAVSQYVNFFFFFFGAHMVWPLAFLCDIVDRSIPIAQVYSVYHRFFEKQSGNRTKFV